MQNPERSIRKVSGTETVFPYEAGKIGGSMPCVMNAANEIAVEAFLNEQISFLDIYDIIEEAMQSHITLVEPELEDLFEIDSNIRKQVKEKIYKC